MNVYRVVRSFNQVEYCNVEASSEEEAINKAIEDDCWEENPNDTFLPYEYIAVERIKYIKVFLFVHHRMMRMKKIR